MSRVGKKPILIPVEVKAILAEEVLVVSGPRGELRFKMPEEIQAEIKDNQIFFTTKSREGKRKLTSNQAKKVISCWGLARSITANLIEGVVNGYQKKLAIEGLGYRAQVEDGDLILSVGFSHPLRVKKIEGIEFVVEKNIISVSGIDKNLVGQAAASIRRLRVPDAYKAKGIRYAGEVIKKKAGKKAGTVTK
ncbi:MAG: 50S ribosomal protein L6 [Candidatus Wildermuthbacteria bacterium GWA2_46_15]|uniref:50S ribosomal protein L6 n=1 Tax=Candidatus Wildermuthbacteria bacterium GWA2_46_15 TaxID=1802443 RepID=A0A1G2QNW0_9BACT|nr:MAG: 50S ribosomal protein L6 [Candidatus Wildermuthbacteria bacterium GWA2_46_15]